MGFLLIKPKTQPNHRQKVGFFHPWNMHLFTTSIRTCFYMYDEKRNALEFHVSSLLDVLTWFCLSPAQIHAYGNVLYYVYETRILFAYFVSKRFIHNFLVNYVAVSAFEKNCHSEKFAICFTNFRNVFCWIDCVKYTLHF